VHSHRHRNDRSDRREESSLAKNIVVFSDGTGQEGGEGPPSNVSRLFNMVVDRSAQQVAFYDRGLGEGVRRLAGYLGGFGISRNVRDCYRFIFDHYEAGDQIFLFGFSRGATTVRSLSGFIHLFGILPKCRPELIDRAYAIYRISNAELRKEAAADFLARHHNIWTRINFLGAWDSVAALGVPFKAFDAGLVDKIPLLRHGFHDLRLSPSVEVAYHALALDEERESFEPVLWDPELKSYQRMEQVWFAGAHCDVGGGYAASGLPDISLEWMLQKATARGLEIYPRHTVSIKPDADAPMHDSRAGRLGQLYRRKVRSWPADQGRPVVHASVHDRRRNRHNTQTPRYEPWVRSVPHDVTG